MYKILIIDDESAIRNTLIKLVNCFHSEYEIVGEAVNGFQGLALINEKMPDIILLDIKMPEMDGITLLEKLRKRKSNCKVIILTAYNDFSYARDALKLSALDYLLKPVKRDDLKKVLNKAALMIKNERENLQRDISIQNLLGKSVHAYRDAVLNQLIEGDNYDKVIMDIPSVFTTKFEYAAVLVFKFSGDLNTTNVRLSELKYVLENDLSTNIKGYCFFDKDKNLVFIDLINDAMAKDSLKSVVAEHAKIIQYAFYTEKGYRIPIGIGRICNTISTIYKSYSEACIALEYRFTLVDKSIIFIDDCKHSDIEIKYPSKIENRFLNSLMFGDNSSIINLNLFFDEVTKEQLNPASLKQICMQLGVTVLKKTKELNLSTQLSSFEDSCFFNMSRYETVNEFKNQMTLISYKIINCLAENEKLINEQRFKFMVDNYLETNFYKNIGLIDVAKELGLTRNYFSSLFKKEVGENFVEYLTQYRIEIAKKKLADGNLPISKIAEMVGFNDVKYFFRVFKKYERITPKEYQQHAKLSAYLNGEQ